MVAHGSVIALAVFATAPSGLDAVARVGGVEHVVFTGITHLDPGRVDHTTDRAGRTHVARAARTRVEHRPTATPIDLAALDLTDPVEEDVAAAVDEARIDVADDELASMAGGGIEFDRTAIAQFTGAVRRVPRPNSGSAYTEDVVEKVVAPYGSNPRPHYPASLQSASIEGSFVVRFVVDSSGRVDAKTLEFPTEIHRLFLKAIRDALLRSRFLPAELGGQRVGQLVQQRFTFLIERRWGSDR
jgi:protein TonB